MSAAPEPTFKLLGAPPQPVEHPGGRDRSGRYTTILGAAMVGWLFFMMALASFAAGGSPASADPVIIERGVVVSPAPGWVPSEGIPETSGGGISLQKAGTAVVFVADEYVGTLQSLLDEQMGDVEEWLGSFRALPATSRTIAGGVDAVSVLFSGVARGGRIEGELLAAVRRDTGLVMLAVAPAGQLRLAQDDLDEMLAELVIP